MDRITASRLAPLAIASLLGVSAVWAGVVGLPNLIVGADNNSADNPFVQPQDPALSGGGRDQSQKFGDVLFGSDGPDLMIGRLGTDVLAASNGDDVIAGGTEHFNPENRDRAFGGAGNDIFLWAPGDGSDFFDGGAGNDVLVFGLMGEIDADGELVFKVSTDQLAGDVYVNPATGLPLMDVTNSPGFCEVIDDQSQPDSAAQLDALGLDHLARFIIRGINNSFLAGTQDTDNGLRVTLHLRDVEFVVCATREGGVVEAFDLRTSPVKKIRPRNIPVPALFSIVQ